MRAIDEKCDFERWISWRYRHFQYSELKDTW